MSASYISVLPTIDPSLLPGVRDHLAATFAAKVAAVLPEVSEFCDFESELIPDSNTKNSLVAAANLLFARREAIKASLIADFTQRFDAIRDPVKARSRRPRIPLDKLTLVQDDQMEEELAVIACSHRLKEQSDYELFTLTRRICLLAGQERIADDANPVYPRVFVRSLMSALGVLEVAMPAKLAVFKAFRPLLLEIMPATYAAGSDWLIERGVELDAYVYHPIVNPEHPFPASASPLVPATANASAEQLGALLSVLHQVMPASRESFAPAARTALVPTGVVALSAHQSAALARELLVDMLDILAADARVPEALRPVIARLGEPLTRLVMLDRSFFTWTAHPARKLLERLAEFGMAMKIEPEDTGNLNSVARIVEDIVRREGSDQYAFKLALERLDELFRHHEECTLQHDPDILSLQASELRECALNATNVVISERLDGRKVPSDVVAFILMTWRAVMVCDYLHGGPGGAPWKLGVATLDELLTSIEPVAKKVQRTERANSISSLVELIRDGIAHAEMNPLLADDFLGVLHKLHQQAIRGAGNDAFKNLVPLSYPRHVNPEISETTSPDQALAELGLKTGMWLEIHCEGMPQCWRLCWVTPFRGYCVLKHYQSRSTKIVPLDGLRGELLSRKATIVEGLNLVTSALSRSFKRVNESIRLRRSTQVSDSVSMIVPETQPSLQEPKRLDS